jgi:hypothetical protein
MLSQSRPLCSLGMAAIDAPCGVTPVSPQRPTWVRTLWLGSSWLLHPSRMSVVTTTAQMWPGSDTPCSRTLSSTLARASAPLSKWALSQPSTCGASRG